MKQTIAMLIIVTLFGCREKQASIAQGLTSMYNSPHIDEKVALDNPYQLAMNIVLEPIPALITNIKLNGGSFFVSPLSTGDFSGKFSVQLSENEFGVLSSEYEETPKSKEEFDPHPFVNGPVNWVSVDTKYTQKLEVNTAEDFKVSGILRFVIEPKCTLEEIPFDVIQKDGVLSVFRYPKLDKTSCKTSTGERLNTE